MLMVPTMSFFATLETCALFVLIASYALLGIFRVRAAIAFSLLLLAAGCALVFGYAVLQGLSIHTFGGLILALVLSVLTLCKFERRCQKEYQRNLKFVAERERLQSVDKEQANKLRDAYEKAHHATLRKTLGMTTAVLIAANIYILFASLRR
jgi:hypothetical protein